MTDPIDDMLRRAGQRWRDTQPAAPAPDLHARPSRPVSAWRSGWLPVTAAAFATAVIAATGFALTRGPAPLAVAPNAGQPTSATTAATQAVGLIVRDGDTVNVTGIVLAKPGQPIKLCAPVPETADLRPDDEPGVPRCATSVPLTGIDLDTLALPTASGARLQNLRIRGIWRAGTIAVSEQAIPTPQPFQPPVADPPPCPAPAGGWPRDTGVRDSTALHNYVHVEHPDQFTTPWIAYPDGFPSATDLDVTTVLVVEVVNGDLEAARAALDSGYDGSLCVIAARPGQPSIADLEKTAGLVQPLLADRTNNIWSTGYGNREGTVHIQLMMITPELHDRLAAIGLPALTLKPWITPAR